MTQIPSILHLTDVTMVNRLLAMQVGIERAAFLSELMEITAQGQIAKEHEGRKYVSLTRAQWREVLPYWPVSTMDRIIHELEDAGVILKANLNDDSRDRTVWHAINSEHPVFEPKTTNPDPLFPGIAEEDE